MGIKIGQKIWITQYDDLKFQNLPQLFSDHIIYLEQMQYRFAGNFGTLNILQSYFVMM